MINESMEMRDDASGVDEPPSPPPASATRTDQSRRFSRGVAEGAPAQPVHISSPETPTSPIKASSPSNTATTPSGGGVTAPLRNPLRSQAPVAPAPTNNISTTTTAQNVRSATSFNTNTTTTSTRSLETEQVQYKGAFVFSFTGLILLAIIVSKIN